MRLVLRMLCVALAVATSAACTAGDPGGEAGTVSPPRPRTMAALGDSITRAFAACGRGGDCVEMSWATGTDKDLNSHWQRLGLGNREGNHNLAVSGARVADLAAQVRGAIRVRPDYVTVLIGANDACTSDERAMTSVEEFSTAFADALGTLVRGLPEARVLVLSVPDLARLWEVGKDRPEVRRVWESLRICQSMLADPTDPSAVAQGSPRPRPYARPGVQRRDGGRLRPAQAAVPTRPRRRLRLPVRARPCQHGRLLAPEPTRSGDPGPGGVGGGLLAITVTAPAGPA